MNNRFGKIKTDKRVMVFFFVTVLFIFIFSSCTSPSSKNDRIIARTGDKVLYFSDIKDIFPKDGNKEDSLSLAHLYIDSWIKTQLLLQKARLNLTAGQADISKEIENYSTSLLIYRYEEQLLREKLDTIVPSYEIQAYYEENRNNFLLEEYAVKALYIKLPIDAPQIYNVKRWYTSEREKDMEELNQYCFNYAQKYDHFNDEWILWSQLEKELPRAEEAMRQMIQGNKVEQEDGEYIYLVALKEKKKPGDIAPLDIISEKMKNIIINKRKLNFINELERNIYNDALAKKQFEIYKIGN